ncbi:hypothetical protein F3Y22_tig00110202pilonHSYRG00097 [Hibiscus syriacus]|uniref:Uncharacterized protein n=1 Tax=Hibiscus syriacus TaxID=106335 RepID=A0A6A3BAB0_HIBSY|nr:hypothetical protein F3Y22_tig00110202pilonHSYRG00097 [Hibiscus syriacus]
MAVAAPPNPSEFTESRSSTTVSGSLHILASDLINGGAMESKATISELGFHSGPVLAVDLRRVGLSAGLFAVKWASPSEFATGGYGFGLQWWDQRRPGGPVSQFKGNWCQGKTSGVVHSIDSSIRKHTCLLVLARARMGFCASNGNKLLAIYLLKFGKFSMIVIQGLQTLATSLPHGFYLFMICSEDGILAAIEPRRRTLGAASEPCAINSFDIDQQNPSDVICSLEWESIAILTSASIYLLLTTTDVAHGGGEKNGRVVGIVGWMACLAEECGNAGCGRLGIDGNGGNVALGKAGGI